MTIITPNGAEVLALQSILNQTLTLKLYSNDLTPGETNTAASCTEVTGGGYTPKTLVSGSWTITEGAPSYGLYDTELDFIFTGATDAPGTIYGYYVIDSNGAIRWIERFPEAILPFTPIAGSTIRITPRYEAS